MAIDTSGKWWTGSTAADIDEYLQAFSREQGAPVGRVTHSVCNACQGDVFDLRVDDEEGCAERTCSSCGQVTLMLDSAEYVEDANLQDCACPCGGESFNLAIGYLLRDNGDVRWVYIGVRCVADGVLGCYADWKIDYGPSDHLLTLA